MRVVSGVLGAGWIAVAIIALQAQQPPNPADVDAKSSGIVRVLGGGQSLGTSPPPASTALETEINRIEKKRVRSTAGTPELRVFIRPNTAGATPDAASGYRTDPDTSRENIIRLASDPEVVSIQVMRPPNRAPVVIDAFNRDARRTHFVDVFVSTYNLDEGNGLTAAIFDGGGVRASHREFSGTEGSRVTLKTKQPADQHATHVAGTMIAAGVEPKSKGMAPRARLVSLDWQNDVQKLSELDGAVSISNHSYGPLSGWAYDRDREIWRWWGDRTLSETEDATFGQYTENERRLDELVSLATRARLLPFVAAGNDRGERPMRPGERHLVYNIVNNDLAWEVSLATRPPDGGPLGLDTVTGLCVAKNVVCVGAIHDLDPSDPKNFRITDYTAFGPTDDGRVKPDVTANGQYLYSAASADDESYVQLPGTSMASPTAAGIGILLTQHFEKRRQRLPLSIELKGILIHSSFDAGEKGPDVKFGWGVVNALAAGHVVAKTKEHLIETFDATTTAREWKLPSNGLKTEDGKQIRVTLVWNDPAPGRAPAGTLDNPASVLQNDLDLELVDPDGKRYSPYKLSASTPLAAAITSGPNRVDNVEVIDAPHKPGTWRIVVKAFKLSSGSSQKAAILTTGLTPQ
jgi:hypothetical protein